MRHEGLGILSKSCLQGLGEGKVAASSFRTSYVPLNKQADFINGMQVSPAMLCPMSSCRLVWDGPVHAAEQLLSTPLFWQSLAAVSSLLGCTVYTSSLRSTSERIEMVCLNGQAVRDFLGSIKGSLGLDVYSFSVFHVFFEQYLSIGRDAAVLLLAAAAAVTLVTLLFTASVWASLLVLLVLCMILVRDRLLQVNLHPVVSVTCSPETVFTMLGMLCWASAATWVTFVR